MANAYDIDSLLAAVNAASAKALHTWIALITFGTYLAIAVGSITHRDLFFESPVNLPLLNVPLPLVAFFVVAPFLFLVMHLYLLMSLFILGCRVQLFEQRLPLQVPVTADQTRLRAQLDPFLILQKLAGPVQNMVSRVLLSLTVWITVIAGPVVLILAFQVQFLPYHLTWVTWWHRILIILDVGMLVLLWPAAIHESSRIWPAVVSPIISVKALLSGKAGRARLKPASAPWAMVSLVVVIVSVLPFSVLLATVPDESVEDGIMWFEPERTDRSVVEPDVGDEPDEEVAADPWWLRPSCWFGSTERDGRSMWCPADKLWWLRRSCWTGSTERDGRSMWCPTAKLFEGSLNANTGKLDSWFSRNLVLPDASLAGLGETTSVTGDPLVLRNRDFRYAILSRADLRNAKFFAPDLRGARLDRAQLQKALLGVSPTIARLQGAILDYANLEQAELPGAKLQGASLESTNLAGALLSGAKLQGAHLEWANLQGTDLQLAHLQGASLMHAELQGASLREAELQGARLDHANLQGADLGRAHLQGAFLREAKLQLATLKNAELQGASLDEASLWPAHPEGADAHLLSCRDARIDRLDGEVEQASNDDIHAAWVKTGCLDYEPSRLDGELAEFLVSELACDADRTIGSNAAVATGLLRRMEQEIKNESRPYHRTVALALLNDGRCTAVHDVLPAADLARFRVLAGHAPPGTVASQPVEAPQP
jgi:uncharacterized protein YjbI with pentapeptide repeats